MQAGQRAVEIDVDHPAMGLERDVFERTGTEHPGVVDQDVEAARIAGERRQVSRPLVGVGDVELSDHDVAAVAGDLITQGCQAAEIDVVGTDTVAVSGEGQGGGAADARGGPGDEDRRC